MREMDFGLPKTSIGPEIVEAARFVMGNGGLVNEASGARELLGGLMFVFFTTAAVFGARAAIVSRGDREKKDGGGNKK